LLYAQKTPPLISFYMNSTKVFFFYSHFFSGSANTLMGFQNKETAFCQQNAYAKSEGTKPF
ncbi:hypothetical protein, partial [Listeria ivanovii]|uniref:hypothetical protein n=1 Tax=Listeria ivanovii TaxID=1638 RepID=UPI0019446F18